MATGYQIIYYQLIVWIYIKILTVRKVQLFN